MSTFGKSDYNTTAYAAFRPSYPQSLYDFIFDFHKRSPDAKFERAVDLGCGTGQATVELKPFKCVTGVDASENMVILACEIIKNSQPGMAIDFVQGPAERLDFLAKNSTDLVIAAQAGHWFDWSKAWPELARVMRKGATAAFWGYSTFRFPRYPTLTPLIVAFDQGMDPECSLGPYWQQPGCSILAKHFVDIPDPNDIDEIPNGTFEPLKRVYFTGAYHPEFPSARPVLMRKTMSWMDLLEFLQTWSGVHTFKERHSTNGAQLEESIEVRFWNALREEAGRVTSGVVPDEVEVEWPLALILARKAV